MNKIGIFGQGFVGNSIKEGFSGLVQILTYDKYKEDLSNSTPEEIVKECDIIFSCVPTPMDANTGEASIHIVEDVIETIDDLSGRLNKNPTVIIKSTVPPGTTIFMNKYRTSKCNVIFNPEFLTEANAVNDFKNQDKIILGVDDGIRVENVVDLFGLAFPEVPVTIVKSAEAEMMKYVINTFLATKVSFLNEIYDICQASDINYNTISKLAQMDKRTGDSHWMVPGPDGDRGWGGHCFPKDLHALRYIANQLSVNTPVLDGTYKTNDLVRTNRDWEKQEGRAIINKI